jgi:hypothetical protein
MRLFIKSFSIFLVLLLTMASGAGAITVSPVMRFSALGGEFFTTSARSTGANYDATVAPVLGLTPTFYLIPIYLASYKQVPSIYDFLGESTLIEKQLDHQASLRTLWLVNPTLRIKPRMTFKREYVKQNTDDSLQTGLFNFTSFTGGLAMETVLPIGSIEVGYDYGRTGYPNYQATIDDPLLVGTGLTSGTGTDILDIYTHESSINYDYATKDKRWHWTANIDWLRQNFIDQKIINQDETTQTETFETKRRTDDIFTLALQQTYKYSPRWTFGMAEVFQYYLSNQNAFDASQTVAPSFTYRYYNYFDAQLNPTFTLSVGRFDTSVTGVLGVRRYSHRQTQDSNGNFTGSLIHSFDRGATAVTRFRVAKGLYLVLSRSLITYTANTQFEQDFPYNYSVFNVFGGITWEY